MKKGVKCINLIDLVLKFNPKELEIPLFFMIFEWQAKIENVPEFKWVFRLIPALPADIAEIIVK